MNKKGHNGLYLLSKNSQFFIEQGIQFTFPALYLKNNTFPLNSAAWGHLHAGASYCLDFHLDPFKFLEEGIHLVGAFLATLAYKENNRNILPHFKVPAILYDSMRHLHLKKKSSLAKIYTHYFSALMEMRRIDERIVNQTNELLSHKYQTREEIVKDILIREGIEPNKSNINQYIYASNHHLFAKVKNVVVTNTFLNNEIEMRRKIYDLAQSNEAIDEIYKKQNEKIVDNYISLDKEKLKLFFTCIYPEEKAFIRTANVSFLYPIFNDQNPILSRMIKPSALIPPRSFNDIKLGVSLDLCIFSAERDFETRRYVLQLHHSFNYSLFRVGLDRTLYEPFLPKDKKKYPYFYFGPGKNPHIKNPHDPIALFFDGIAERNKLEYRQILSERGYNQTRGETVTRFVKGLVPFHDFIEALREEKYRSATINLIIDLVAFIPLIRTEIKIAHLTAKLTRKSVSEALAAQTMRASFLKTMAKRLAIRFDKLPVKSLSKKIFKETLLALDPGLNAIYLLSKLSIKATDTVVTQIILFLEQAKEKGIAEATGIANAITEVRLNPMHRIDFSNIQKISIKGERDASVVELKNFDDTIDYIRIDPSSHVLFGNKYTLGKDHQLVEKSPIEMFYPSEPFVSTGEVRQLVDTINQEIDVGCFATIYYGHKERYQSKCQIKLPPKGQKLCLKQVLEREKARVSIQAQSSKKAFHQLAYNLSTLDQKRPAYKALEQSYFSEWINYLFAESRAQTYLMLIETLKGSPNNPNQPTQTGLCLTQEKSEKPLKKLNRAIDVGCSIPIGPYKNQTYESKCQIEELSAEQALYAISALSIDWPHLSAQLRQLKKISPSQLKNYLN